MQYINGLLPDLLVVHNIALHNPDTGQNYIGAHHIGVAHRDRPAAVYHAILTHKDLVIPTTLH